MIRIFVIMKILKMPYRLCLRNLMKIHEDLKNSHHKLSNDNTNLTNHVKRLKENLDKKDHALCEVQERERRLKVQTERLSRDLKREKDETVKLRKQLQSKDIQHTHELRRIQQSGQKLRVQLEKTAGSYMPKDKASQKLQTETDKKLRVYEQTIQRLEDNNGLMLEEINELRETLALHTNGIELQVEASGVWDDTKT
ncbi:afadin- and alpha-actinin-binding protein-like isoform X3 [Venturia canescens]|uniref:afadin- and alpha-actinin-binding protein-like isoform X3 n=1 Tax=Venturia canescens TaxID=32260 RepID=UPI001C9BF28A|nr:afadin- and alpha-actinin-binding protein-like isoform X3 [Venturia canescens]